MTDYGNGGSLLQFKMGTIRSVNVATKKAVVTLRPEMQD